MPFKILWISTAIVFMGEIRNESRSPFDNKVSQSEIEYFKTNRSARFCNFCILLILALPGKTKHVDNNWRKPM